MSTVAIGASYRDDPERHPPPEPTSVILHQSGARLLAMAPGTCDDIKFPLQVNPTVVSSILQHIIRRRTAEAPTCHTLAIPPDDGEILPQLFFAQLEFTPHNFVWIFLHRKNVLFAS